MVYNPPVLREGDAGDPVVVTVSPVRSGDAYIEQAKRASGWVALYLVGWLWQQLLCQLELPSNCQTPDTALEVLTDLLTLVVFGVTQAWFCEILEERRFRHLKKEFYFLPIFVGIGISLSAIEKSQWWKDLRFDDNSDWDESHVVVAVLFIVSVALIIAWHFAEAWRILPGAYYVSGQVNVSVVIKENLHRIYNVSRGLIVAYALLYAAFAFESGDGFEQHYILLAWVLSLLAQFKSKPSIIWLALTTGVFIQGIGAHRLAFLCNSMGNRFVEGDSNSADSFGDSFSESADSSDSNVSNDSIPFDDDFSNT